MGRHVRLRELLVGVEGLALLRNLYDGSDDAADRRLTEVRQVLDAEELAAGEPIHEAEPAEGYRAWSSSYDEPGNPIIELEQPAVWSLLDSVTGRALDAACGTGRHAGHLVAGGHEVLGVDLSPEMLERAALNVPGARFSQGDLCAIPVADEEFDLVICGLALSHVADLRAGVAELARALRPGGLMVISVLHPFQALLGWHAPFVDEDGGRAFVREHSHSHADYLAAFNAAGVDAEGCLEPRLTPDHVRAKKRAFSRIPDAVIEAYAGLPGVLVWSAKRPPIGQRRVTSNTDTGALRDP
jgi:SAM-dependent methyltransferase